MAIKISTNHPNLLLDIFPSWTSSLPYTFYKINKKTKTKQFFTGTIPIFTRPNQFLLDLSDSPVYFVEIDQITLTDVKVDKNLYFTLTYRESHLFQCQLPWWCLLCCCFRFEASCLDTWCQLFLWQLFFFLQVIKMLEIQ